MREMISLQCKKILVVGGRLLDPRDSYNNENKELVNSLTIGKWQIEADLDKRVIRIKGPNRAIYPLMEGAIFLYKDKNENNVEVYFTKFYDTKILEFLKKYGIDDVIVEDPIIHLILEVIPLSVPMERLVQKLFSAKILLTLKMLVMF